MQVMLAALQAWTGSMANINVSIDTIMIIKVLKD